MGFKWRPYTADSLSNALPGVVLNSISTEVEIKAGDEQQSWAFVYRLTVLDVRDNELRFIVKRVKKPASSPPTADATSNMIKSYTNEINFYLHHAQSFDGTLFLAKLWSSSSNDRSGAFTLLLSDLKPNFNLSYTNINLPDNDVYKALTFLAAFHAQNWELNDNYDDNLLFKRGGICAVAGEDPERVKKMVDPWDRLREASRGIKERVFNGGRRKHRTIIHGDFRLSNLLFNETACTAVDYQYCGYGYGMVDVVNLLCSSVDSGQLARCEEDYVKFYFQTLNAKLRALRRPPLPPGFKLEDALAQFDVCFLDYCRFYCVDAEFGCSVRNNDSYVRRRCTNLLDSLSVGCTEELTEAQWSERIFKRWPTT